MKSFLAALRFLTVLPVPGECSEEELGRGLFYFPVVGVFIGLIAALSGWYVYELLPPLLASVVMVVILIMITGGFHLDGLADSADGFFSARLRPQMLEIMRDSRIGAMGVLALLSVLLLKITALSEMGAEKACITLFLMPVAGRTLMVIKMALFSYVRKDGGVASVFVSDRLRLRNAAFFASAVLYCSCWFAAGTDGLLAGGLAVVGVGFFGLYCKKKIGGITGDTLGAASELAETAMAIGLAMTIPCAM